MCVGCRTNASVDDLVRLSANANGTLNLGPGTGRGAWLCAPPAGLDCLTQAVRRGALDKALHIRVLESEISEVREKLLDPVRDLDS